MSYPMSPERVIDQFTAAANHELDIHVWRSNLSPWMRTVAVMTGEAVDTASGYDPAFEEATGTVYGGIMTLDEVNERLKTLLEGEERYI